MRRRRASLELAALDLGRESRGACSPPSIAPSPAPGARELAARLASPLRDADAIGGRLDAVGFLHEQRDAARGCARRAEAGARSCARDVAAGVRTRRAARSRLRCAMGSCRRAMRRAAAQRRRRHRPARRSWPRIAARLHAVCRGAAAARSLRRSSTTRRICAATAASSAPAIAPELDEARALRDDSRRVMAALEARYIERDRRQGAEGPPQQHPRLLHRGDAGAMPSRCCSCRCRDTFRHRQTMAERHALHDRRS